MTDFLTLADLALKDKTVLLRADLNVPMRDGNVTDSERLERLMPTLKAIGAAGGKIALLSHFGRPRHGVDPECSLRPAAAALERIWGQTIAFADDCVGPKAAAAIKALAPGQIVVLENTRFHAGEEANDPAFAQQLALLGDVYVNDAFSCAHRAHASTEAIAHLLPAAAGCLMQAELEALHKALAKPERPLAAIIGGSKISTKLDLLNNLVARVDVLVLGGGMANTFLAANGIAVGKSICEHDMLDTARGIAAKAAARGCAIVLPKDAVVATAPKAGIATQTVPVTAIPADAMMLDTGPQSIKAIEAKLSGCKTVVWNGPLGMFEIKPFDAATNAVAKFVADLTQQGKILSVAGGGDTASAMNNAGVAAQLSYLSVAGGAFLEWLEGKELPGVAALRQAAAQRKKTG